MKTYNLFPELKRILEDKRIRRFGFPPEKYENYLLAEQFVLDLRDLSEKDISELQATYADLKELGLDEMPYRDVVIHSLSDGINFDNPNLNKEIITSVFFSGNNENIMYYSLFDDPLLLRETITMADKDPRIEKNILGFKGTIKLSLIVMLATRNAIKERHEARKPANRLTGKSHKRGSGGYTIIRCPEYHEIEGGDENGTKKRPHLRRGHIRKLHPIEKTKWIWIAPCFVNGEPEVNRTSYLRDSNAST